VTQGRKGWRKVKKEGWAENGRAGNVFSVRGFALVLRTLLQEWKMSEERRENKSSEERTSSLM